MTPRVIAAEGVAMPSCHGQVAAVVPWGPGLIEQDEGEVRIRDAGRGVTVFADLIMAGALPLVVEVAGWADIHPVQRSAFDTKRFKTGSVGQAEGPELGRGNRACPAGASHRGPAEAMRAQPRQACSPRARGQQSTGTSYSMHGSSTRPHNQPTHPAQPSPSRVDNTPEPSSETCRTGLKKPAVEIAST
jgi:hypothetical protein